MYLAPLSLPFWRFVRPEKPGKQGVYISGLNTFKSLFAVKLVLIFISASNIIKWPMPK